MFLLKKILAALILPPAGPVLPALLGLWLARSCKKFPKGRTALALATRRRPPRSVPDRHRR